MNFLYLIPNTFVFITIILIDRVTKSWALGLTGKHLIIGPHLSFALTFNRGINWGFLNTDSLLMARIITVTIAIVILLFGWFTYRCFKNNESGVPHMLILSGAVSNLWDRIFHPGVIDFIILSVGSYSWPTFNIADVAIVSGILLLAYKTYHTE